MDPETGTSPAELLVAHCVEQGYPVRCAHSVGPLSIIIAACAIARVGVRPTPPPCLGPELWAGGLLGSHRKPSPKPSWNRLEHLGRCRDPRPPPPHPVQVYREGVGGGVYLPGGEEGG